MELRAFRDGDLESLYAISLATGAAGGDASALYGDGRLIGHIYSAPYAKLSPETAFVAEDEGGVTGFVVGTLDTRTFEARLEAAWWPTLRAAYPDPSGTDPATWTPDQRRSFMIHHPMPVPEAVLDRYPSHLHLNLLPRAQGIGIGRALLARWIDTARRLGGSAVHLGTNAANTRSMRFWSASGFARLPFASERTVWFGRDI